MPFIGGALIALGFAWIFAWGCYSWLLKSGITGQRPGTAFKTRTRSQNAEWDSQAQHDFGQGIAILRRSVPAAALVIIAGVVVAIV